LGGGEDGYGSEYDSPFAQEETEKENAISALIQSQQELGEGIGAARKDILAVQVQMGDIMRVFSMLTEAVYYMPAPAEKADSEAVLPETISLEIDALKRQLEATCAGLSKNGVAMLTMETKTDDTAAKVSRIEQTLPELISSQSDFSSKMNELLDLIDTNRSEIVNLAANTERVDCLYEGFDDMYEIALALTRDVGDTIARLEEVEAGGADVVDAARSAGDGVAEVEIMPPTAYVKLQSVGNEADHVKIAMELLDFLLKMVGPNNLPSILDYYIEIGWISETARLDLLAYASGLGFAEEKPDWKMGTEDHLKALWFIDQLCGHKTDKTRLFRVNHEIAKMYKGIDVLYEI
jgi:archaellum component FlaD/FlaE